MLTFGYLNLKVFVSTEGLRTYLNGVIIFPLRFITTVTSVLYLNIVRNWTVARQHWRRKRGRPGGRAPRYPAPED